MNWIDKTIRLCPDWPDFLAILESQYTMEISAQGQTIDGTPVAISSAEHGTRAFALYEDDYPLTRYRIANVIGCADAVDENGVVIGRDYRACWPETFLADLARDPQLFGEAEVL